MDSTYNPVISCCSYRLFWYQHKASKYTILARNYLLYTFYIVQWPILTVNYLSAKNKVSECCRVFCKLWDFVCKTRRLQCAQLPKVFLRNAVSQLISSCQYSCPCGIWGEYRYSSARSWLSALDERFYRFTHSLREMNPVPRGEHQSQSIEPRCFGCPSRVVGAAHSVFRLLFTLHYFVGP